MQRYNFLLKRPNKFGTFFSIIFELLYVIYHKIIYKLYVNKMLNMLIHLVKWVFICTFVVGKIIYNKKSTYLYRQVHLLNLTRI